MRPATFNSSYIAVFFLGALWGVAATHGGPWWVSHGAGWVAVAVWFAMRRLLDEREGV